jgi:GMP synthase-like glutamine amidotransferase
VPYAVDNAKKILGKKPVFGICMGHQVLGQAFGGKTFKLKFGHHGGNHPLRHTPTGGEGAPATWVLAGSTTWAGLCPTDGNPVAYWVLGAGC